MWKGNNQWRIWLGPELIMVVRLACLFGLVVLGSCVTTPTQEEVIQTNLFQQLEQQGYQPNLGLAGIYAPGNLIQTQAPDDRGEPQPLPAPILFMWGTDCFPDQPPRVSQFVVADSAGRDANAFRLNAGLAQLLLPMLKFDRSLVADYRVELGEGKVHTLAKGDISQRFSPRCVDALTRAMSDGDNIEWFSVIVEAVVVDSLNIEMSWQSDTTASARMGLLDLAQRQLTSVLSGNETAGDTGGVGLVTNNARQSVLRASGPVIIGYRVRPLQPVYQ